MRNTVGKRFPQLAQKFERGRTEQRETAGLSATAAAPVYQATQGLKKEFGGPLHFVQDDQLVFERFEIGFGIFQLGAVRWPF